MSTRYFLGAEAAVAQKNTFTIGGTLEAGDKLIITMTAENLSTYVFSYSAASATKSAEAILMAAAWNASTNALCTPITATAVGDTVELLADVAGVPFFAAASTTESDDGAADDQTFTMAATTPNAGPSCWSSTANWSGGAVPVTDDIVIFDGRTTVSALYGMNQTGVDLAKMHVMPSYTGSIGSAGAPLIIECKGNMIIQGEGTGYYIQCGNDAADADVARLVVNAKTTSIVGLSSQKNAGGGNVAIFTEIIAQSGRLTLYGNADKATTGAEDGTAFGTMFVLAQSRASDLTIVIGDQCEDFKSAAAGSIYVGGGVLTTYSDALLIYQTGGTVNVGGTAYTMDANDDNITMIRLLAGTLNWHPSTVVSTVETQAAPSPSIGTLHAIGGTFDASLMKNTHTTAPTITLLVQYASSTVTLDNDYGNIAVTTWTKFGGVMTLSPGQSAAIS